MMKERQAHSLKSGRPQQPVRGSPGLRREHKLETRPCQCLWICLKLQPDYGGGQGRHTMLIWGGTEAAQGMCWKRQTFTELTLPEAFG